MIDERPRIYWSDDRWIFECPGCGSAHFFDGSWTWDGNVAYPTVQPSIRVSGVADAENDPTPTCCHFFITAGRIQYLGDCTHKLAGKTVDMEPW